MSRVLEYKVGETIHPVNNWIKYIKEKGGKANKGDEGFSKEIKKNDEYCHKLDWEFLTLPFWFCICES